MISVYFSRTLMSQSAASISVGTMVQFLRENGHIVDMKLLPRKVHTNGLIIAKNAYDHPIVLLKINFQDYSENIEILSEAKRQGLIKRLFVMGQFATFNGNRLLSFYDQIDGVIIGKFEDTALALVNSLMKDNENFYWDLSIPGGIWREPLESSKLHYNPRNSITPLNLLPYPARDIEKLEHSQLANLEFSIGCSNNCSYCHMPLLRKYNDINGIEIKDTEKVIEEVKVLKYLGKKFFIFNDSVFWRGEKDTPRIKEFINELKKNKLSINFMIYLTLSPFPPEELISQLREVGLVRIFIGVENVVPLTLKKLNKNIEDSSFEKAKAIMDKYNVSYHIGFILFHPFSTVSDIKENVQYLSKIQKLFRIGVIVERARLIPGTTLYDKYSLKEEDCNTVDLAYNYKFNDAMVQTVFDGITDMFVNRLNGTFRETEVLCTSSTLALSACHFHDPNSLDNLHDIIEIHQKNINEYQTVIKNYLDTVIDGVENKNWDHSKVSSPIIHNMFINEYNQKRIMLQLSWGKLLIEIKAQSNIDIERIIFKGDEKI